MRTPSRGFVDTGRLAFIRTVSVVAVDPVDRRVRLVEPTGAGTHLWRQLDERSSTQARLLDQLSSRQRERLAAARDTAAN